MECPSCKTKMEDIGYGDKKCRYCGRIEYACDAVFNKQDVKQKSLPHIYIFTDKKG